MDLQTVSIPDLRAKYIALMSGIAAMQADANEILGEVTRRHGEALIQQLKATDRESGEVTRVVEGVGITLEVKKTVKWDAETLVKLGRTLSDEVRRKLLKLEVKVPERVYTAITDPALLAAVKAARTVTYSQPKIKFTE